ncbi:Vacuolar protease A [Chytriomyces hyalinus]|nr:Vacuolar protease A [Chytriomyces hyalinus]
MLLLNIALSVSLAATSALAECAEPPCIIRMGVWKQEPPAENAYVNSALRNFNRFAANPAFKMGADVGRNLNRIAGANAMAVMNHYDQAYYANISFGTPPQETVVQIDTGSAAFWIGSKSCNDAKNCNDLYPFDSAKSSTYMNVSSGKPSNVTYGAGSIGGVMSSDVMNWGSFTIPKQQFILVDYEDPTIFYQQNGTVSGLVGFAYQGGLQPTVSAMGYYETPIYSMVRLGMISQPLFSIWLNGSTTGGIQTMNGGEVIIGGVDSARYNGDIMYYPIVNVSKSYFWMVEITNVQIVGTLDATKPTAPLSISPLNLTTTYGLMDSGTSLITIDPNFYTLQLLPTLQKKSVGKPVALTTDLNTGYTRVACTDAQRLPSIALTFGGKGVSGSQPSFEITWQDYVLSDAQGCYLGFQAMNMKNTGEGNPVWIFGDVFLRKVFTVYDFGNGGRVGLAYAANTGKAFGVPLNAQSIPDVPNVKVDNATVSTSKKSAAAAAAGAWSFAATSGMMLVYTIFALA